MSLKINNAYQIKPSQVTDIIKDLHSMKKELFDLTVKDIQEEHFQNEKELNDYFQKEYSSDWNWMKCSVIFYFYKGKVIIQFFNSLFSLVMMRKLILKYDMKDYSYQNNSDPEKVRNWKEREKFWTEFSDDFGTSFKDKGLEYRLISNDDIIQLKLKSYRFPKVSKFSFKSVLRDFFEGLYNSYGKPFDRAQNES